MQNQCNLDCSATAIAKSVQPQCNKYMKDYDKNRESSYHQ